MPKKEIAKTVTSGLWLAIVIGMLIFVVMQLNGSGYPVVVLGDPACQIITNLTAHIGFAFTMETLVTMIVVDLFFYFGIIIFVVGVLFTIFKKSLRFLPLPFAGFLGMFGAAYIYEAYVLIRSEPGMFPYLIFIYGAICFVLGFLALVFETNWCKNLKPKKQVQPINCEENGADPKPNGENKPNESNVIPVEETPVEQKPNEEKPVEDPKPVEEPKPTEEK